MHDAHVHLDFMTNGEAVAEAARAAETGLFAVTVRPSDYAAAQARFGAFHNVRVGVGAHPWWADSLDEVDRALLGELVRDTRFVGEVGLDFGKRYGATRDLQFDVFSSIARTCGECGGKVLSIHSVKAAAEVLDVLSASGALESCACVFHWYSGPSDQLKRAIDAGCYFSIGARMLATAKGREYVKAIPAKRLLLETDAPPGQGVEYTYAQIERELDPVVQAIAALKGEGAAELLDDTFNCLMG